MTKIIVAVNERGLRVGDSHQNAKYSNAEVDLVLQLRDDGFSYGKIVKMMEMPKSTVASIIKGCRRCQFADKYKIVEVG